MILEDDDFFFNNKKENVASYLNFSFVIMGKLAGMAMPGLRNPMDMEIALLREAGITDLINLTETVYTNPAFSQSFQVHWLPVPDYEAPTLSQMRTIEAIFHSPAVMAVHCMAGVGRTGTVLACLVGRDMNLDGYTAIAHIRRIRRGSVESGHQAGFICDYLDNS